MARRRSPCPELSSPTVKMGCPVPPLRRRTLPSRAVRQPTYGGEPPRPRNCLNKPLGPCTVSKGLERPGAHEFGQCVRGAERVVPWNDPDCLPVRAAAHPEAGVVVKAQLDLAAGHRRDGVGIVRGSSNCRFKRRMVPGGHRPGSARSHKRIASGVPAALHAASRWRPTRRAARRPR